MHPEGGLPARGDDPGRLGRTDKPGRRLRQGADVDGLDPRVPLRQLGHRFLADGVVGASCGWGPSSFPSCYPSEISRFPQFRHVQPSHEDTTYKSARGQRLFKRVAIILIFASPRASWASVPVWSPALRRVDSPDLLFSSAFAWRGAGCAGGLLDPPEGGTPNDCRYAGRDGHASPVAQTLEIDARGRYCDRRVGRGKFEVSSQGFQRHTSHLKMGLQDHVVMPETCT